jgi:hypothetical protein
LSISTVLGGEGTIDRQHKKPKTISISAKTARVPFGPDEYVKTIAIPCIYDEYNYNMNAVDKGDQLAANNIGLRLCRKGGWQAIEH